MRIGIDYRILAVGSRLVNRGMGRYTQQQLRAVLGVDADNEYILLCNAGADLALIEPSVRTAPNVVVRSFPGEPGAAYPATADRATALRRAEEYQDWVWAQGIDLYHATTPFLLHQPVLNGFDACPVVATFYDVIPLVFPDRYLADWSVSETYLWALAFVGKADRLVAISEASRQDAVRYLGVPADRIEVAWPVADARFRPMAAEDVQDALLTLRRRARVPESFALSVTHLHHSKNLLGLLRAYAVLPRGLRGQLPLVVACHFDEFSEATVRRLAHDLGIGDDVVLTGLVSNAELAALYNAATMVVHPSRYEGFGLPLVEAMQSGTPVVTTTASALPEVAGDAALLVDPDDVDGLAEAMRSLWAEPSLRREMAARGLARARRFDGAQLARHTLDSYRKAVAPAGGPEARSRSRPHVAMWTPLPPQETGVAGYAAELVGALEASVDVEMFVDDGVVPRPDLLARHRIHHFSAFGRRHRQRPFDAVVYQMGATPLHLYMYAALRAHPGVVVLHDLTLSHVLYLQAHDGGDVEPFRQALREVEGRQALEEWLAIEDRQPGPDREKAMSDFFFQYPMLGGVVDDSLAQVVHYDAACGELARRYPRARPYLVPMGVRAAALDNPRMAALAARRRLAVDADAFVVGTFGVVHPFKRLESCLRAMSQLVASQPSAVLLVVGSPFHPSYADHLVATAHSLGVADHVRFTGHLPDAELDAMLAATDVVVNLRFPFMKQMSATILRAAAAGKPVVITDVPEWRFLPEEVCPRVPLGDEVEALTACLAAFAGDAAGLQRAAAAARAFFEKEGTIDRLAHRYLEVLDDVYRLSPPGFPA